MNKYIIFTAPGCSKCILNKKKMNELGIKYTEINTSNCSPEEEKLVEKYNVMEGGTIINIENGEKVNIIDLMK